MAPKLLVVDDDAALRKVLRMTIGSLCTMLEAADGQEALRVLKAEKPKLMLLDVTMPGMGGIDVLRAAKKIDASLVVLMLTGSTDLDVAKLALENGALAYITKPFEPVALRAEIQRLLGTVENDKSGRPWRVRA